MFVRIFAFCLLIPVAALAEGMPDPLGDTVSDYANLIPAEAEARIAAELTEIRAETGVHLVVATMDRLANFGGADARVEDYAKALFDRWGIGEAARNDGILILVVSDDRVARIALGSGYDAVYDGRAQRVVDTAMLPLFAQGKLAEGIAAGVSASRERLIVPFLAGKPVTVDEGFPTPSGGGSLWGFAVFAAIAALASGAYRAGRARKICPNCTLPKLTQVERPKAPGATLVRVTCASCGHSEDRPLTVRARTGRRSGGGGSGGGGSGGGGFGGGRSSGGGATGRW